MFPEHMHDMEEVYSKAYHLQASLKNGVLINIEQEITNLRKELHSLSEKICAKQEITEIFRVMTKKKNSPPPRLESCVRIKTDAFAAKYDEIDRILQSSTISYHYRQAEKSVAEGAYLEALRQCEKVLTKEPRDKRIRLLLSTLMDKAGSQIMARVQTCLRKFHFQHLHSFGHGIVSIPQDLYISNDAKTLFVSDHGDNSVHRFNTDGEYLGKCDLKLIKPRGIFSNEKNTIWVCDLDGQRLLGMNKQGEQIKDVYFPKFVHQRSNSTYPCWGANYKEQNALIVTDRQKQEFSLLVFRSDGNQRNMYPLSQFHNIDVPCGIHWQNGNLWVGSLSYGQMFLLTDERECLNPVGTEIFSNKLKAFAPCRDTLFLNSTRELVKISDKGKTIFTIDLSVHLGKAVCLNFGLAIADKNSEKILFAPDGLNKCIHAFSV